ncbi:bacteriohemerythrin [Neisseria shayeganii]|uniref:Bacteriohemerythrin n=1 Tax=Neisseria shayeganii TaxID=607712 RepID=A0A7D7NAA2_9NEIS|nr:bacteriohemerythrin [Neisseria shayeganii]QMT40579.1 bacteriohemerythrin [Neisseria shayeganii]
MPFIYWTPDLDTGFDDIDEQHKVLVQYINDLYDAKEKGDKQAISEVFQHLIDYTVEHFSYEEMMLQEADYHLIEPHKKVHANFVSKMNMFQSRYNNGDNEALDELLNLLEGWLFRHIRLNDHGYVDSVKKAGVR